MNCPGHMLIYQSEIRSYRDLPLRLFELGTVYRYEKSGVLHGLLRVRGFTQDDAHIFCTEAQVVDEVDGVIDFVIDTMKVFGFDKFEVELSTRPKKSIGTDAQWQLAEESLKQALKKRNLEYDINVGEGAFYGPKIDIKLKDALNRQWQCATIQCDFALPERFDLTYVDVDGKEKRPVMLHRVLLGSLERFIGALLEHYGGDLPLWLAPVQAVIIPIKDEHHDAASRLKQRLTDAGFRVELDTKAATLNKRIREAEMEKTPFILVLGDKEIQEGTVSVRRRLVGDQGAVKIDELVERLRKGGG
jgi:threonyl-tRNA synthetase